MVAHVIRIILTTTFVCWCMAANNYTVILTQCKLLWYNKLLLNSSASFICDRQTANFTTQFLHPTKEMWSHLRVEYKQRRSDNKYTLGYDGEFNLCDLIAGTSMNPIVNLIYTSFMKTPDKHIPRKCPFNPVNIDTKQFYVNWLIIYMFRQSIIRACTTCEITSTLSKHRCCAIWNYSFT